MRSFILKIMAFYMVPVMALAANRNANVGLGGMANSLMGPVGVATSFMHGACFLVGGAFLFASIVKYVDHRRSPTMVPFSTVVFLIVAGLMLLGIPLFTS